MHPRLEIEFSRQYQLGSELMTTKHASRAVKLFSAILLLAAAGGAQASAINLGGVSQGDYGFGRAINFGETFTDYVNFTLSDSAEVSSFIKSFDMSVFHFDLLGIDNFTTGLERFGSGGYSSIAALTSNPASFDDLLAPGSYRFAIAGTGSGFFGGIYRGTLHVAAVPEADTWVMLLMAFGIVVYQLRRKQRSLEQPPAAALIA
jgi:hypothetical protein